MTRISAALGRAAQAFNAWMSDSGAVAVVAIFGGLAFQVVALAAPEVISARAYRLNMEFTRFRGR